MQANSFVHAVQYLTVRQLICVLQLLTRDFSSVDRCEIRILTGDRLGSSCLETLVALKLNILCTAIAVWIFLFRFVFFILTRSCLRCEEMNLSIQSCEHNSLRKIRINLVFSCIGTVPGSGQEATPQPWVGGDFNFEK